MFIITQGYNGDIADIVLQGYVAAVPAPTPTPEPEPTPTPTPAVRAGAGHNILELGWYDDKPWIRHRDRETAKAMREAVEDDNKEHRRRRRQRAEAIAVAIMMLER